MPTTPKTRTRASRSSRALPPSRGAVVCRFFERYLVHGEGDKFGQAFSLTQDEKRLLYRWYELRSSGARRFRRGLIGRPKGYGKTELAAGVGVTSLALAGQHGFARSPLVPVMAASFEQADLLFGSARTMITEGPLAPFFDVFDTEILRKDGPGRMYRVAAAAGSNDGQRPSDLLADEIHELVGRTRERAHLVLSNGLAKRRDSAELNITTAGFDPGIDRGEPETLAGRLYVHGKRVEAGEVEDPEFFFDWTEASSDWDLDVEEQLEAAIREANPHVDLFGLMDRTKSKFEQIPRWEFERYFLNRWTGTPESWLPPAAWDDCLEEDASIPPGAKVVIGVDIGTVDDNSAVVLCHPRDDGRVVVEALVFEPRGGRTLELATIDAALHQAAMTYRVEAVVFDEWAFERSAQDFEDMGLTMVKQPMSVQRMSRDSQQLYDAILERRIAHDGDPVLAAHVRAAAVKPHENGWRLVKGKDRKRKIDACIALALAHGYLSYEGGESVYEQRGLVIL